MTVAEMGGAYTVPKRLGISRFALCLLSLVTLVAVGCGSGQGGSSGDVRFPSRDLTYLIPYDPGGPSDREARRQQPLLEKYLGRRVIIDYKPGAGGALGWAEASRANPDGHLFVNVRLPHFVLQPMLQPEAGYQTDDLRMVVIFQRAPIGLLVKKDSPYQDLDAFLRAAKEKPGSISISGSGSFTPYHLTALRLEKLSGAKLKYVPFNGGAPAMTAFLGGHTTATVATSDEIIKYQDDIRVLAIADETRFALMPDVPTFKELGYDLISVVDSGVAVPIGTPDEIVRRLEEAFLNVMRDSSIQEAMKREGSTPLAMDSTEASDYVAELEAAYKALVDEVKQKH